MKSCFLTENSLYLGVKINVMTLTTFLIAVPVLLLLAVFVRHFWEEILITWLVLQVIFYVVTGSLITAFLWYLFFGDNDKMEGFGLLWLFHGIVWTTVVVLYVFIAFDVYNYAVSFIRNIFKIK